MKYYVLTPCSSEALEKVLNEIVDKKGTLVNVIVGPAREFTVIYTVE